MIDYPFFVAYRIAGAYSLPLEWYLNGFLDLIYENYTIRFKSLCSSQFFKECFSKYFRIRENNLSDVNNDISNFIMKSIVNNEYILIPFYFDKNRRQNITRLLIYGIDTDSGQVFSNKRMNIFEVNEQCRYSKEIIISQDNYNNFLLESKNIVLRLKPSVKCQLLPLINGKCDIGRIKSLINILTTNTKKILFTMVSNNTNASSDSQAIYVYNCAFLLKYYAFIVRLLNDHHVKDDNIFMQIKLHCNTIERFRNTIIKQKVLKQHNLL